MLKALARTLFAITLLCSIAGAIYGSYRLLRSTDFVVPSLFTPASVRRTLVGMDGFRMMQSEGGRTVWSVRARTAELNEVREALLREVEIVTYHADGRTAALIGETGTMDTVKGNATIRRGAREVRVVTSDGYLMTTDSLTWRSDARVVRTVDPFRVLGREIYLEGKGLSADPDLRKVVVESNVKAVLQE